VHYAKFWRPAGSAMAEALLPRRSDANDPEST
jgi:hypothetical protein